MFLLPFEHVKYSTTLDEDEVKRRLQDFIETHYRPSFWSFDPHPGKPYTGAIWGSQFIMSRIIDYRNSFLPVIKGRIRHEFNGMIIDVKMQLHPGVIAFLIYWIYFWGQFCTKIPLAALTVSDLNPEVLMPYGMLLLAYTLTMTAFRFETNRSRKELRDLFEGQILE